jgi:hypothetical protein
MDHKAARALSTRSSPARPSLGSANTASSGPRAPLPGLKPVAADERRRDGNQLRRAGEEVVAGVSDCLQQSRSSDPPVPIHARRQRRHGRLDDLLDIVGGDRTSAERTHRRSAPLRRGPVHLLASRDDEAEGPRRRSWLPCRAGRCSTRRRARTPRAWWLAPCPGNWPGSCGRSWRATPLRVG